MPSSCQVRSRSDSCPRCSVSVTTTVVAPETGEGLGEVEARTTSPGRLATKPSRIAASGCVCVRDPHAADRVSGGLVLVEPVVSSAADRSPPTTSTFVVAVAADARAVQAHASELALDQQADKAERERRRKVEAGGVDLSASDTHRHDSEHPERRNNDAPVLFPAVADDERAPRLVDLQRRPPNDSQDKSEDRVRRAQAVYLSRSGEPEADHLGSAKRERQDDEVAEERARAWRRRQSIAVPAVGRQRPGCDRCNTSARQDRLRRTTHY